MLVLTGILLITVSMINADQRFATCFQSNSVTIDDMKKFGTTGESSQNFNCALRCIDDYFQLIKPDGTYDADKSASNLPPPLATAAKKCAASAQPSASDPCQVAYQMHKCMVDEDKQAYTSLLADASSRIAA